MKLTYTPIHAYDGTQSVETVLIRFTLHLGTSTGQGDWEENFHTPDVLHAALSLIEQKKQLIEQFALINPQRFWHFLIHLLPKQAALIAALDIACWSLWSNLYKKTLPAIWAPHSVKQAVLLEPYAANTVPNAFYLISHHNALQTELLTNTPRSIDPKKAFLLCDSPVGPTDLLSLTIPNWSKLYAIVFTECVLDSDCLAALKNKFPTILIGSKSNLNQSSNPSLEQGVDIVYFDLTTVLGVTPFVQFLEQPTPAHGQTMLGYQEPVSSLNGLFYKQFTSLVDFYVRKTG